MLDENGLIPCKICPAVFLKFGEDTAGEFNSGCSVVQVNFSKGCKIGFIKFKNNYVASISIRIKFKDDEKGGTTVWKTVLKNYVLMVSPHHESGSQDYFQIDVSKEFSLQAENITVMRIVLRQPSPHWKHFSIEDLEFYLPNELLKETQPRCDGLEKMAAYKLTQDEDDIENISDANTKELLSKIEKMESLARNMKIVNSSRDSNTGKFEVDGKYDLNLLSYS